MCTHRTVCVCVRIREMRCVCARIREMICVCSPHTVIHTHTHTHTHTHLQKKHPPQLTATHCTTPAATDSITLQHTATHLQQRTVHYNSKAIFLKCVRMRMVVGGGNLVLSMAYFSDPVVIPIFCTQDFGMLVLVGKIAIHKY